MAGTLAEVRATRRRAAKIRVFASLHQAVLAPLPAYVAGEVTLQAAVDKVLRRHAVRQRD